MSRRELLEELHHVGVRSLRTCAEPEVTHCDVGSADFSDDLILDAPHPAVAGGRSPARPQARVLAMGPRHLATIERVIASATGTDRRLGSGPVMRHSFGVMLNYRERIVRNDAVCGGEPVIRGTRVTLRTVLASLVDGDSIGQILEAFPTLHEDDVRAAIAFAADSAREDLVMPKLSGL